MLLSPHLRTTTVAAVHSVLHLAVDTAGHCKADTRTLQSGHLDTVFQFNVHASPSREDGMAKGVRYPIATKQMAWDFHFERHSPNTIADLIKEETK